MTDLSPQKRAYWEYQYRLGKEYLLPLLKEWGLSFQGTRVLDIGCGEGGLLCALAEAGAKGLGIEISPHRLAVARQAAPAALRQRLQFVAADFFAPPFAENQRPPDLIILRDVFEHLPNKPLAIEKLKDLLAPGAKLFITFPPFYAPFGGHQQMLKSFLRRTPYFHSAPEFLWKGIRGWIQRFDGNPKFLDEMEKLRRHRVSIGGFRKMIRASGLRICREKFYISRPSYHIRFGWPIIDGDFLRGVPVLREVLISGAFFLIAREQG
jgi:SAM-dependent methyltransferase